MSSSIDQWDTGGALDAADEPTRVAEPARATRATRALRRTVVAGWRWSTAWRRTRPFWGGLWCVVAGAEIIKFMHFSIGLSLTGGWNYSAGYVMGGGLILFGLTGWFAPHFKSLAGVIAFLISLAAFPTANLGGFLLGSVLGIVGSSMMWSWGPKRPSRRQRKHDVGRTEDLT